MTKLDKEGVESGKELRDGIHGNESVQSRKLEAARANGRGTFR